MPTGPSIETRFAFEDDHDASWNVGWTYSWGVRSIPNILARGWLDFRGYWAQSAVGTRGEIGETWWAVILNPYRGDLPYEGVGGFDGALMCSTQAYVRVPSLDSHVRVRIGMCDDNFVNKVYNEFGEFSNDPPDGPGHAIMYSGGDGGGFRPAWPFIAVSGFGRVFEWSQWLTTGREWTPDVGPGPGPTPKSPSRVYPGAQALGVVRH